MPAYMIRALFLFFSLALCTFPACAQVPGLDFGDSGQIGVQNAIIAKIDETTISMMDVKKKMDVLFYRHYPHLADSTGARYQFYETSWRHVLMEMIDHQLILADAAQREVPLSEGDIREELEARFGPHTMETLEKIGVSYDEAWKMVQEELLVQRMTWWFIHSKALANVTPELIRKAYKEYLVKNPPYTEWKYRVVSLKGEDLKDTPQRIATFLQKSGQSPETLLHHLQQIDPKVQVSDLFVRRDWELSPLYKEALEPLSPKHYSDIQVHLGKNGAKEMVMRIFYVEEKGDFPAPSFEELSPQLRQDLTQKEVAIASDVYLKKLRSHYDLDLEHIQQQLPEDFHPFLFR